MPSPEHGLSNDNVAALVAASAEGNLIRVQELISALAASVDRDDALSEAAFAAARKGNAGVIAYLFDLGVKCENAAYIIAALQGGSPEVFNVYIQHGWDVNTVFTRISGLYQACPNVAGTDDTTLLISASASAPLSVVRLFVSQYGADPTYPSDALVAAASSSAPGRVEVMEYLLDHGAPIDKVRYDHNKFRSSLLWRFGMGTPLHAAVEKGDTEKIKLLLARGASVEVRDSKGRTARDIAEEKVDKEIL